jgi:SAM-dependent methyltransferase
MTRDPGAFRFDLSDEELERVAEARRAPLGRAGFARMLLRAPWLVPETIRIATRAVDQSLAGSSALSSLVSAERARMAVPDAATGAGWHPEEDILSVLRPLLGSDLKVLELGCGAGRLSRHIAPQVAGLTCTDMSRPMVAEARRNLASYANVQVVQTDGFTLGGLPDQGYDLVFAAGMFGYVEAAQMLGLFDEIHRVLRAGGTLTFSIALIDDPRIADDLFQGAREGAGKRRASGFVERPYCLAQIEAWLRLAGLAPVSPTLEERSEPVSGRTNVVARREQAG